jgi:Mn2+/Fe2+ NRAMP family transporter
MTEDKEEEERSRLFSIRNFGKSLGPGVITGASDDDPSGIATYSQAGAKFGLGLLWTVLFQLPMMIVIQEMCARIGLVPFYETIHKIFSSFTFILYVL